MSSASAHPLRLEDTVEVDHLSHRLAMGMQWVDALSRLPATGNLTSELERIGSRPLRLGFDLHSSSRHALRWAGLLAKILVIAAKEKVTAPPLTPDADPTNFVLRGFARRDASVNGYSTANDPRRYVPRRLALMPVQSGGMPTATKGNIRQAWLWPGTAYPLPGNTTALRGRVRRGPTLATARSVPWTRIIVTRPAGPANFATETRIGWGHGDDRGEFLVVLGFEAIPGGAILPQSVALRIWVFLPPAGPFDATDPLASLPLEQAGSDPINDVLRGIEPPAGYVRQAAIDVTLKPGEVLVMNDAVLLFP